MSSLLSKLNLPIKVRVLKNVLWNVLIRVIGLVVFFYWEFQKAPPTKPYVPSHHLWLQYYSFPYKKDDTVSDVMLIMLTSIVPIVIYGVLSLWLGTSQRSIVAEQYRFIMSQAIVYQITGFLTDLIKTSVSALRPDYLARCFNWTEDTLLEYIQTDSFNQSFPGMRPICPNPDESVVRSGQRSFPSGHASLSTATYLYMTLRLHSSLRRRPIIHYKGVVISFREMIHSYIVPIGLLPPLIISISRFTDYRHHPVDILCGILLGVFVAILVHYSDITFNGDPSLQSDDTGSESSTEMPSFDADGSRQPILDRQSNHETA
jgi:membrane-associated phospholipid phosphatase